MIENYQELSKKIKELRRLQAIECDPTVKLIYKQKIEMALQECSLLEREIKKRENQLRELWESLNNKLFNLEKERIMEPRVEEQFRLEHNISQLKLERQEIEQRLNEIEAQYEMFQPYPENVKGTLKIQVFRGGEIDEVIKFLNDLQEAYDNLYVLNLKISEFKLQETSANNVSIQLSPISQVHEIVMPVDKLVLDKVHIASPGFWEVLGSINPLIQIREYLKERHERRKDKEYREAEEHRKMILENMNFKTDILSKQIDLLKKANIPEENIRRFVMNHYYKPLIKLNPYQDTKMIGSAEVISIASESISTESNELSGTTQLELPSEGD